MNDNNAMISQQARSIAASAVNGNAKTQSKKFNVVSNGEDVERNYSFAFFVGALLSIIAALCLGFLLGVLGVF